MCSAIRILVASFALLTAPLASASIVSMDSTNPSNGSFLDLAAGSYRVDHLSGAWNPWGVYNPNVGGCDPQGRCNFGWAASVAIQHATGLLLLDNVGFWASASLADSAARAAGPEQFSLASAQKVRVFISDSHYVDNAGSVTVSITAVPEPHRDAMFLAGLGLLALAANRRRRKADWIQSRQS